MAEHGVPAPFTVLMVCTGNICRSPLAEQLLRARLRDLGIEARVLSAGNRAMVGHGMTPEAASVSHRYGGAGNGHAAQLLTEQLVSAADLVLTAAREHRSAVVALHPRAARYSYTLNQFARLLGPVVDSGIPGERAVDDPGLEDDDGQRMRALVAEIAATRGYSPPPAQPSEDDIEDPYRQSAAVYDRVGAQIDIGVTAISRAFATVTGRA